MIHRQNWLDVRDYLNYIERVRQNDIETVKRARSHLRHLLEWADDSPLVKARGIDPTFPSYLAAARSITHDQPLAPASIVKCLANARQFFSFARAEWPLRYRLISESWIDLLQPPRAIRSDSRPPRPPHLRSGRGAYDRQRFYSNTARGTRTGRRLYVVPERHARRRPGKPANLLHASGRPRHPPIPAHGRAHQEPQSGGYVPARYS